MIEVCRALWTEQHVKFKGQWHEIDDAGVAPMPIQQPIPIWIGAFAPPAIQRAARLADGWQAMLPKPDAAAEEIFTDFRDAVLKAGRDPSQVGIEATIFSSEDDPDAWLEEAQGWFEVGASQIVFRPQGSFQHIRRVTEQFGALLPELH